LPTEDNDDEYANGGIIAFAEPTEKNNYSLVTDPLGNVVSPESGSYYVEDTKTEKNPTNPETASDRAAILNMLKKGWTTSQDIGSGMVRGAGTVADYFNRGIRAIGVPETLAPRVPSEYTFNRSDQGLTPFTDARVARESTFNPPNDEGANYSTKESSTFNPPNDAGVGVAGLPAAQNVKIEPDRQGAGAGAGGGALPPTLAAAEKSNSSAAARAVSAADEYMAMLKKNGESVGREKKEAFYMALISGGLAAAGGTSPNALANIAAGMVPATQQYQKVIAGIRKDDRERLEKLMGAGLKKDEFALKAEEIGINRKKAEDWYEVMMDRNNAMRSRGGDDSIKRANAIRGLDAQLSGNLQKVETNIKNLNASSSLALAFDGKPLDQVPEKVRPQVEQYRSKLKAYENEKIKWNKLHTSRVTSLGGETLGDIYDEGPTGSDKGLPMPKSAADAKVGETYNTSRGPAKWDGKKFNPV
jgi:hypothetical protein